MVSRRRSGRSTGQKRQSPSSDEDDPLAELTRPQLLQINRIFKSVTSQTPSRDSLTVSRSFQPESLDQPNEQAGVSVEVDDFNAGGFIVNDEDDVHSFGGGGFVAEDEAVEAGGFMVDSEVPQADGSLVAEQDDEGPLDQEVGTSKMSKKQTQACDSIQLRSVPEALRLLGLPYKDSSILEVFEQAASSDDEDRESQTRWVNRRQFTRVCAALMAGQGSEGSEKDVAGGEDAAADEDRGSDRSPGSDSDASFVAPTPHKKKRRTTRGSKATYSDDSSTDDGSFIAPDDESQSTSRPKPQSKKQTRSSRKKLKKELELDDFDSVLDTFQLFFPSDFAKDRSAITFTDIRRIADELGEKMTDEEIQEMLGYASGTNDFCVDLTAFERLLGDIKAV